MPRKSHHVVPNPNGGWNIKKGGADRVAFQPSSFQGDL
jgi:hypothetical protein